MSIIKDVSSRIKRTAWGFSILIAVPTGPFSSVSKWPPLSRNCCCVIGSGSFRASRSSWVICNLGMTVYPRLAEYTLDGFSSALAMKQSSGSAFRISSAMDRSVSWVNTSSTVFPQNCMMLCQIRRKGALILKNCSISVAKNVFCCGVMKPDFLSRACCARPATSDDALVAVPFRRSSRPKKALYRFAILSK